MMTAPDAPNLLDDVLAESSPDLDSLGPMLRAVRARRRRRRVAPVAVSAAMLVATLAWTWFNAPSGIHPADPRVAAITRPAPSLPAAAPLVQRINSQALASVDRVTTTADSDLIGRVRTRPEPDLRASDRELLALAGGRGLGLFRFEGRTELMFAGRP